MEHKITLAERKIKLVLARLNNVLNEERIYGQEFNKQIIKALIIDNLTKNTTLDLMKELEEMPISQWND